MDIRVRAALGAQNGKAEAAFWRSAVWLPAEAARAPDRPAGIGPADATRPIKMETALPMGRLGPAVSACGGTPTKQASALLPVCITSFVPSHRRVRGAHSEGPAMVPSGYGELE